MVVVAAVVVRVVVMSVLAVAHTRERERALEHTRRPRSCERRDSEGARWEMEEEETGTATRDGDEDGDAGRRPNGLTERKTGGSNGSRTNRSLAIGDTRERER
jgi:hypothetical protein